MPTGAPLAGECLAQERFDEGSNRRHDCLPSDEERFTGRGDVAHEVGGGLQIPVGRIDVDVTHVGRQRRHMRAASAAVRPDCLAARAPQTCAADRADEGGAAAVGTMPALPTSLSKVSLTAM